MEITEKVSAAQAGRQERQPSAYLPPQIEAVEIRVERGFEGSLDEIPDTPWETY